MSLTNHPTTRQAMRLGALVLTLLYTTTSLAQDADRTADQEFFEKKIRPVLVEHCYDCHAADAKKVRGGLLLDSRSAIRAGGESGAGVVPGNPEESLVLDAIRYESFEMPPSGKLPERVIADFEKWIHDGAVDPREAETKIEATQIDIEAGKEFWCFRPVEQHPLPEVEMREWPESAIDAFLLHKLEAAGLSPVADADRPTLIRRVSLALVGLPPTPQEIQAFIDDPRPTSAAFSRLVDRLLESKHYGERWGRHWLDVVRFAESSGGGRTLLFPNAWRYRDYVIDAFNADMPYDQFLREQIAGDLLPHDDWQTRRRQLTATTFLLLGPTNYELQDKDILEMDIVDEQIDTIGKAFLGMTVGCARCHDHKFDPIPMTDYYAMAGIFKSTRSVIHSNVSAWNTVQLPVAEELESQLAASENKLASLKKQLKQAKESKPAKQSVTIKSLQGVVVDDTDAVKTGSWVSSSVVANYVGDGYIHDDGKRENVASATFRATLPTPGEYLVRLAYTPGGNRSTAVPVTVVHAGGIAKKYVNQKKKPDDGAFTNVGRFQFDDVADVVVTNQDAASGVVIADAVQLVSTQALKSNTPGNQDPGDNPKPEVDPQEQLTQSRIKQLEKQIRDLEKNGPTRPVAMAPVEEDNPGDIHLAIRGVVHNKGPLVPRGVLQVALSQPQPTISDASSGRLELSDWIANRNNPLTARMIVNRVWYWLFGEGLVRSVDNFGSMGSLPSHPELLDHLALEFMNDGWSIKRLVRRIVLSHVYRLSSDTDLHCADVDSSNRLLWRMHRRRLDAESVRDSLLQVAGSLDRTMGGANIKDGTKIEYDYVFDSTRRSVYLPVFRNTLPEIFATFDFADPNIQGGKRTTSTIAPQALLLMNNRDVVQQTRQAAARLLADNDISPEMRIDQAYLQVLGRKPTDRERYLAEDFLGPVDDAGRWSLLYQTLFQSLDFRYVR